jgi:hypothetical protein
MTRLRAATNSPECGELWWVGCQGRSLIVHHWILDRKYLSVYIQEVACSKPTTESMFAPSKSAIHILWDGGWYLKNSKVEKRMTIIETGADIGYVTKVRNGKVWELKNVRIHSILITGLGGVIYIDIWEIFYSYVPPSEIRAIVKMYEMLWKRMCMNVQE